MNTTTMNRLAVATTLLVLILVCGCGKTGEKKQPAKPAKDTTALKHDSTAATTDSSLAKSDSSAARTDSSVAAADTTHAADTTKTPPPPKLTYEQRQGKYVYAQYCAVCHGVDGKGDGFNSYNLDPKPRDFSDSGFLSVFPDERLAQVIRLGGHVVNRSPTMPAYEWTLGKDEIGYVVSYVRFLSALPPAQK